MADFPELVHGIVDLREALECVVFLFDVSPAAGDSTPTSAANVATEAAEAGD